ncbi:mRNA-decapping enzyme 1A-like [Saccostrea cucullata]|uniref:mRNA-decapping enzyme 1A-like n=1 Tax=Saccostrea cuccullata TaxID=36930 RepID=UPI002ED32919
MAEESRMNLAALQQRDPYINEIAETATQVALYSFNPKTNQWEKTSIEGSLFVYKRSASPNNGFMILNRLGLNNLIEPITKDLEFQLQDPFLLYRNTKAIYGIWFYDKDECARIGQLMNSLLQLAIDYHRAKSDMRQRRASESDSMLEKEESLPKNVDILQMLSKAQHEYDKSKCSSSSLPKARDPKPLIDNPNASATKATNLLRPTPLKMAEVNDEGGGEPDRTKASSVPPATAPATGAGTAPISLETLFRNASLQQQSGNRQDQPRPQPFHRSMSMTEGDSKSQDLLRHIMSSGSMVEDIERQQHRDVPPKPPSAPSLQTLPQNFKSDQRVSPPNKERENKAAPTKYDLSPYLKTNEKEAEGGEDKGRRKSPSVQTEGAESLLTPAALQTSMSLSADVTSGLSRLLPQNPDVLLTPMAFTQSPKAGSPATTLSFTTQDSSDDLPIAALTREQLQQALVHLIKNDSSFIDSIHQAYLNSLKLSHKT